MKSKSLKILSLLVGLTLGFLLHSGQAESADPALLAKAKIGEEAATKIALKKVPNAKVESKELEEENGKLVWSFDLQTPGTTDITEVQVDAKTGAVVSTKIEKVKEQMKEKEEDAESAKK